MDLAANTIRWMKSYDSDDGDTRYIEGLALNPAEDKVAVYTRKAHDDDFRKGR